MRLTLFVLLFPLAAFAQESPFAYADGHPLTTLEAQSNAALWGDLDGDGDLDLFVTNTRTEDNIWVNQGDDEWSYEGFALQGLGIRTSGALGDLDNDGDLDLVVSTFSGSYALIRRITQWEVIPLGRGEARDASLADVDNDGRLDVFSAVRGAARNELYLGTTAGFEIAQGGDIARDRDDSVASSWADVDEDGDLDLYVANSGGARNRLYLNKGGSFISVNGGDGTSDTDASGGASWGDVDGDGDLDLVVTNQREEGNVLYLNKNGELTRADAAYFPIVRNEAKSSAFGDVDNDGDLDLVIATKDGEDTLYLNRGANGFKVLPFGSAEDGWAVGATLVDPDEDGDLDLFISHGANNVNDRNRFYTNTTDGAGHWLALDLEGVASNRSAIGARVDVHATIGGAARRLVRVVESRSGRTAQSGLRLHVGLGDASRADSIVVRWPSGVRQVLQSVGADQTLTVTESATTTGSETGPDAAFFVGSPRPNPAHREVVIPVVARTSGLLKVDVLDARGRRVWSNASSIAAGESRDIVWLSQQTAFAPGVYHIHVRLGDRSVTRRVTLVR